MRTTFLSTCLQFHRWLDRSYKLPELMKFFNARKGAYHTNPRLIDEAIYTTYSYGSRTSTVGEGGDKGPPITAENSKAKVGDLLGIPELQDPQPGEPVFESGLSEGAVVKDGKKRKKFDQGASTGAEIFMFNYGTVVIWGMSESEERRFLSSM